MYTTTLTITESTSPSGEATFAASASPIVAREVKQPFLERLQARQEQLETVWNRRARDQGPGLSRTMWAISVKRQRKLKMKKHKYKKLMRRTRNLRRREGRN